MFLTDTVTHGRKEARKSPSGFLAVEGLFVNVQVCRRSLLPSIPSSKEGMGAESCSHCLDWATPHTGLCPWSWAQVKLSGGCCCNLRAWLGVWVGRDNLNPNPFVVLDEKHQDDYLFIYLFSKQWKKTKQLIAS